MSLTKKQKDFIELVKEGKNCFLTGKAGTGKSYIVKEAFDVLKGLKKKYVALAPTGVAANNINGQTIHSFFSINPFGVCSYEECNFLRGEKRRLMDAVEVIFIDEISMLRPDVLDGMNWTLLKNGCKSLSTKQIIFVGDLKQLPPPINDNTRSILYRTYDGEEFFHAKVFSKLNIEVIELEEILRQNDEDFINALNIIRDGGRSEYFRQFVSKDSSGVILCPYNSTVEKYNKRGLEKINSELLTFDAIIEGNARAEDFNLPTKIEVKQGAKIMYLVNSQADNGLINGSIGIFASHNKCHYIQRNNLDIPLIPVKLSKKEYILNDSKDDLELKEIGSITQYPFKLAFALSIHKSQGLTFEEVTIDLTRPCFQKGQMYVGLSRVTTPKGLKIIV